MRLNKKKSILILDDDLEMLTVLKEYFELKGYGVYDFSDAAEAIEFIENAASEGLLRDIQLIITDLSMPEIDGYEFLALVKSMSARIPVFVISALPPQSQLPLVEAKGAQAFFNKPFSLDLIEKKVSEAICAS